jgi:hypothetical protein
MLKAGVPITPVLQPDVAGVHLRARCDASGDLREVEAVDPVLRRPGWATRYGALRRAIRDVSDVSDVSDKMLIQQLKELEADGW